MMERCCETCLYNLGGGYNNCKINLEAECAAGEYEAWKEKENSNNSEHVTAMDTCSDYGHSYPVKNFKLKFRSDDQEGKKPFDGVLKTDIAGKY